MDHVEATLKKWRSSKFEWGKSDCLMSVGIYASERSGINCTAPFYGLYDDEAGARALIERHGGEMALLDRTGFPRASLPGYGDILLLAFDGVKIAGICTGDGDLFSARLQRGVISVRFSKQLISMVWKVS